MKKLLILLAVFAACGETEMAETRPTYFPDFASLPVGLLPGGAAVTVRPPAATRIQGWPDGGFEPPVNQLNYQFDSYAKWLRWLAAATARPASYVVAASSGLVLETEADLTCDGVSDQEEINSAIGLVALAGGGVVQLTEGLFVIDAKIIADDTVTLRGMGPATVIQVDAAVATSFDMVDVAGNADFWIDDFTLDGNNAGHAQDHSGISFNTFTRDSGARRVRFINMSQNTPGPTYGHGVHINANEERIHVDFCYFDACEGAGILEEFGAVDTSIIEPTVIDCGAGASVTDSGGIILVGTDTKMLGGTIDASYIANLSIRGDRNTIIGPKIRDSLALGLEITGDYNVVSAPTVYNSGTDGIEISSGAVDNTINGGVVSTSAEHGLHVYGDRFTVGGGFRVHKSGYHGIYFNGTSNSKIGEVTLVDNSQGNHNFYSHIYVEGGDKCAALGWFARATALGGLAPKHALEMDSGDPPLNLLLGQYDVEDSCQDATEVEDNGLTPGTNYFTVPRFLAVGTQVAGAAGVEATVAINDSDVELAGRTNW